MSTILASGPTPVATSTSSLADQLVQQLRAKKAEEDLKIAQAKAARLQQQKEAFALQRAQALKPGHVEQMMKKKKQQENEPSVNSKAGKARAAQASIQACSGNKGKRGQ